jgi:zinc transporter ZupT
MIKGLSEVLSQEALLSVLAASGGIARIVVGTNKIPNISWVGEVARILFVALPVGVMSGLYIMTKSQSAVLPLAASFSAGVVSLNIVRFLLSAEGLQFLRKVIGGK